MHSLDIKQIAIVGSSGESLRNHGGDAPEELLAEIEKQATAAGIVVGPVIFVAAKQSLSGSVSDVQARLILKDLSAPGYNKDQMTNLETINHLAQAASASLAQQIRAGAIHGLVLVSSDPQGVNRSCIEAAAATQIPVVSTGATSSAAAEMAGVRMILSGGSTGSTNLTRAVAYSSALGQFWSISYRPEFGQPLPTGELDWSHINPGGILNACLPAFIVLSVVSGAVRLFPSLVSASVEESFRLGAIWVVTTITAYRVSQTGKIGLIAGGMTGALVVHAQVELIGGLWGGIVVGLSLPWALKTCYQWRLPANVATLLSTVIAVLLGGGLVEIAAPVLVFVDVQLWEAYQHVLAFHLPVLGLPILGLVAGATIRAAIRHGLYHRIILPLILFEMSKEGVSLLGTIDIAGLVMVAAGVELAHLAFPRQKGERAVARSALTQSLGYGTYVEGAYPFMVQVRTSTAMIAGLSGLLANALDVQGTAYVPVYLAPLLSNQPWGMTMILGMTLAGSFLVTLSSRFFDASKQGGI
jgi:hypothetical protein